MFEEARRSVHRDGYVEFKRAYYSAPPEYVGRQIWVRQEARLLRLYNPRREQIALHALAEPGKFTTDPAHLHSRKRHIIERGADHLLDRCRLIGPLTGTWAQAMHQTRGPQSLRVMLGLLQLAEKHPAAELEKAAGVATHHGTWRLRDL
ncbi:MAG: Mu transposase domain-containing protein, partial [Limisphaerales bacterium]